MYKNVQLQKIFVMNYVSNVVWEAPEAINDFGNKCFRRSVLN